MFIEEVKMSIINAIISKCITFVIIPENRSPSIKYKEVNLQEDAQATKLGEEARYVLV